MADKKNNVADENQATEQTQNTEQAQNTEQTQAKRATKNNKKPKMRKVFIPKKSKEDTDQFVAVNGKAYKIPKGKDIEVPEEVAKVLDNMKKQKALAEEKQAAAEDITNNRTDM